MIDNKVKDSTVISSMDGKSSKISDQIFIKKIISDNLYSDKIGSLIRETVSNAVDSVNMANSDKPVHVDLSRNDKGDYIFSVKDYGLGMSVEKYEKNFVNYGDSDKRDTNVGMGMWGLGSKSPFAYTKQFYVDSCKDGVIFKSIQYQDSDGDYKYDIYYKEQTDLENFTEVKVPVKSEDTYKFRNACIQQLKYIPNIYFSGDLSILNDDRIEEHKYFYFHSKCTTTEIVVGGIKYDLPRDFRTNGVRIGLKFKIGELRPTPSRESIEWDDNQLNLLKDRYENALTEVKQLLKQDLPTFKDFINSFKDNSYKTYNDFNVGISFTRYFDGMSSDILNIRSYNYVTLVKQFLKCYSHSGEFYFNGYLFDDRYTFYQYHPEWQKYSDAIKNKAAIVVKPDLRKKGIVYLYKNFLKTRSDSIRTKYYSRQLRDFINWYQKHMTEWYMSLPCVTSLPKNEKKKKKLLEGELRYYDFYRSELSQHGASYDRKTSTLENISKHKHTYVYFEDVDEARLWANILHTYSKFIVIRPYKSDYEKCKNIKNMMTIKQLDSRFLRRIITAKEIYSYLKNNKVNHELMHSYRYSGEYDELRKEIRSINNYAKYYSLNSNRFVDTFLSKYDPDIYFDPTGKELLKRAKIILEQHKNIIKTEDVGFYKEFLSYRNRALIYEHKKGKNINKNLLVNHSKL